MGRILLIEDNEANQNLVVRYLGVFGHQVIVAGDAATGLALATKARGEIDLVLLDINLPDLDGWEVARRLKTAPVTRALPIIAVTAHAMVGDRETALAAGCDDYVTKPIEFKILVNTIQRLTCEASVL